MYSYIVFASKILSWMYDYSTLIFLGQVDPGLPEMFGIAIDYIGRIQKSYIHCLDI